MRKKLAGLLAGVMLVSAATISFVAFADDTADEEMPPQEEVRTERAERERPDRRERMGERNFDREAVRAIVEELLDGDGANLSERFAERSEWRIFCGRDSSDRDSLDMEDMFRNFRVRARDMMDCEDVEAAKQRVIRFRSEAMEGMELMEFDKDSFNFEIIEIENWESIRDSLGARGFNIDDIKNLDRDAVRARGFSIIEGIEDLDRSAVGVWRSQLMDCEDSAEAKQRAMDRARDFLESIGLGDIDFEIFSSENKREIPANLRERLRDSDFDLSGILERFFVVEKPFVCA